MDIVADTVPLQHHFGGAFQNDAAPDMRTIQMPGHGNVRAFHAGLAKCHDGLPYLLIDRRVAFRMAESFAQDADAQASHRLA